ncbi:16S rRNA (guanine(527)-N(7))-methyltransferase RsmG [Meiothermus sp.]|uniref:16S rRNA (guanine(527)-N(7))-methyltransferase RsmG n=1 Tax=Meiothermus sp. TaxID=1955249 RepID=UPI0021DC35E7|nr:16S rRNA (guanine(527)-N(7))-methyltransferase RsmG [Meiothermus sp.]GIW25801.1 MAG: ribosomal RNA small subunit methyltransferase G [Meiothermus sp.]
MQMTSEGRRLLLQGAQELGLDLEPHIPRFARFFELLTHANQTLNLTAIRDEEGIVLKHFVDSLTCLIYPGFVDGLSVIDVGTGAGFPGLPLAIVRPKIHFDLLDATQKKVGFVARVIQDLELSNAQALWGRAETLAQQNVKRETYDAALTRAVASLATVAELTLPLVRVGGFVLAQKGAGVEAEVEQAQGALRRLGGVIEHILHLKLPHIGDERALIILRKTAPTPPQYPRKPGVPAKNPLS